MARHATMTRLAALAICLLATNGGLGGDSVRSGATSDFALGPARDASLIEDFTAERLAAWTVKHGVNVDYSLDSGYEIPGVATTLMRVRLGSKSAEDKVPSRNWFSIERKGFPPGAVPEDADGLRIMLGSHSEGQWWISVSLVMQSGETFTYVIDHVFPAGRIVQHSIPFEQFTAKGGGRLTRELAQGTGGLRFGMSSGPGRILYLDRITTYRQHKFHGWLDVVTSHPANNLFERTDRVSLNFAVCGTPPAGTQGFRYEIRDFFRTVTARGTVPLAGARECTLDATPARHGYYELQAFFTDAGGRDIEGHSCIRAEGSVPSGLATFSVMPCTIEENVARFKRYGEGAFFGMHGDILDLADHVGLTWRFGYTAWRYLEAARPDRSTGMAAWARQRMTGRVPDYRFHIQPFMLNLGGMIPAWAKNPGGKAPAFADWADAMALVRDQVRVEKSLYPHMKPRIYGGAWEVNLNMQPFVSQTPEHSPEDVATLYRRIREVVKTEDPDGIVIGPCPSTLNPAWFETVFKAGVLEHLDGIETHAYNEGAFTPEANDIPGKIGRLNALVCKYNRGRPLPIYCTERGERGMLGADTIDREQAQNMIRAAIILKGEGVRVFLPFYGIDCDHEGYGFLYNRDIDSPRGPYLTRRVSPKPLVSAMAACVKVLEGALPQTRIRTLGDDVWAYVFARDGATTTALWTTGVARNVALGVGNVRSVEVLDFMGHATRITPLAGSVSLAIDGAPIYAVVNGRDREAR